MSSQGVCMCVVFFYGIVDSVLFPLTFLSMFVLFAVVVWYNKKNHIQKTLRGHSAKKKVPQIRQGHKVSCPLVL